MLWLERSPHMPQLEKKSMWCKGGAHMPQRRPRAAKQSFHPRMWYGLPFIQVLFYDLQCDFTVSPSKSYVPSPQLVTQSCRILCDPMDCNLSGSSVHGILQAGKLEWVAIPFSRGSFQPRDWTQVSHIAGRFFTVWATRKAPDIMYWTSAMCWALCWCWP